jgi:uncharacterized protein (UPF0254 family)
MRVRPLTALARYTQTENSAFQLEVDQTLAEKIKSSKLDSVEAEGLRKVSSLQIAMGSAIGVMFGGAAVFSDSKNVQLGESVIADIAEIIVSNMDKILYSGIALSSLSLVAEAFEIRHATQHASNKE